MNTEPQLTYFAVDGSYGSAERLIIIDTSRFTEKDWLTIELCSNEERGEWAEKLNEIIGE